MRFEQKNLRVDGFPAFEVRINHVAVGFQQAAVNAHMGIYVRTAVFGTLNRTPIVAIRPDAASYAGYRFVFVPNQVYTGIGLEVQSVVEELKLLVHDYGIFQIAIGFVTEFENVSETFFVLTKLGTEALVFKNKSLQMINDLSMFHSSGIVLIVISDKEERSPYLGHARLHIRNKDFSC